MKVRLVTSWNVACGIAQHSKLLMEGVQRADSTIEVMPDSESLDPACLPDGGFDLLHLNMHAALHSRWLPEHIRAIQARGIPCLLTYHDPFAGTAAQPNSEKCHALYAVADAFIVHEAVEDLPNAIHWRHGVPEIQPPQNLERPSFASPARPIIGSAGFDFGWKNYDLLCEAAALAGWRVLLIGPYFTEARIKDWQQWQPDGIFPVLNRLPSQAEVVSYLSACD